METTTGVFNQLGSTTKRLVRRLATVAENRLELLTLELQEERERVLQAFLLALGVAAFGLLAAMTLTATIVVLLWAYSPWAVLLTLTALYGAAGFQLYRRLASMLQNWQTLPASIDQIRKDRECLEKTLT